jgi:hypothetical protein
VPIYFKLYRPLTLREAATKATNAETVGSANALNRDYLPAWPEPEL